MNSIQYPVSGIRYKNKQRKAVASTIRNTEYGIQRPEGA